MKSTQLLRVGQVSDILNVSPSCVYELVARHELAAVRVGVRRRGVRIRLADLKRYILENTTPTRHRAPARRRQHPAPSAFTHLDAARMQAAWEERDVE